MRSAGATALQLGDQIEDEQVWRRVSGQVDAEVAFIRVISLDQGFAAAFESGVIAVSVWGKKDPAEWVFESQDPENVSEVLD